MPLRRLPQRMLRSAQGPVIVLPAHRRGEHVVRLIDACGRVVRPSPTATREIRVGQTHQHAVVLAQRGRVRSRRQAHQRVVVRTGPQHRGAHEKTGRLAHLGPKRLVLRHAFRRSAAGQDEHFGAVVEQQARLPHRQRITTRKRLKIEQAGIQGDRAAIEGPSADRQRARRDRQKLRVAWRKLRAQDHPLGVLPDEVGGNVLWGGLGLEVGRWRVLRVTQQQIDVTSISAGYTETSSERNHPAAPTTLLALCIPATLAWPDD